MSHVTFQTLGLDVSTPVACVLMRIAMPCIVISDNAEAIQCRSYNDPATQPPADTGPGQLKLVAGAGYAAHEQALRPRLQRHGHRLLRLHCLCPAGLRRIHRNQCWHNSSLDAGRDESCESRGGSRRSMS